MSDQPLGPQPQARPKTSGLAIASLVCGLLFFIPIIAPALAILFGIFALIGISSSKGGKRGQGAAIAGIVLGGVFTVCWCVVVPAVGLPAFSAARQQARAIQSRVQLRDIGLAVAQYRKDSGGKMPETLQALYDGKYIKDAKLFRNISSGAAVDPARIDETGGYYYPGIKKEALETGVANDAPIVWEKVALDRQGKVNVLEYGGTVRAVPFSQFQADVDKYKAAYEREPAMPEVTIPHGRR